MTESVKRTIKGGRKAFFENAESDRLLAMLMRFMNEHWALKERVMALEILLSEQGILAADSVENFKPDANTDSRWDQESFQFIQAVVEAARNIDD